MAIEAVDTRARGLRSRRQADVTTAGGLLRRLDWPLMGALVAVVSYGLWAIDGITMHDPGGSALSRQALYAGVGAVLFVGVLFVDPDRYRILHRPIYFGTLGVMVFVLLAGAATRGSKRWINVGFFTFQPSEFGKVLFVLALAGIVAERARTVTTVRTTLALLAYGLGPIVLVFVQPDIGTALVYTAALAAVLFVAGVRWSHLAVLLALTVLAAAAVLWLLPSAGVNVLKPYQTSRLTGFTHPDHDPSGATYNLTQSITAVGAGGLRGRGVLGATQTRLNYLPEHATDFAFASLSEQRGFFGASILLLLYLLIVWRALKVVTGARDLYSARRCRRNRLHVHVPGVRQQCDDDGDRADHRNPAAVRLGRRLVDDHELPRTRRSAGDPHASRRTALRMRLKPLALLAVVREVRRGAGDPRPLAVAGARELVPLLAKELRAGGDAGRSRRAAGRGRRRARLRRRRRRDAAPPRLTCACPDRRADRRGRRCPTCCKRTSSAACPVRGSRSRRSRLLSRAGSARTGRRSPRGCPCFGPPSARR